MRSGLATTEPIPVLAAGVGLRYRSQWLLRSVSFRLTARPPDGLVLGIATSEQAAASAVVDLLAGLAQSLRCARSSRAVLNPCELCSVPAPGQHDADDNQHRYHEPDPHHHDVASCRSRFRPPNI